MDNIPVSCKDLALLKDWEIKKEIGRGSSGIVYHVENSSNQNAALKWIHLESNDFGLSNQEFLTAQEQLMAEIRIMKDLSNEREVVTIHNCQCKTSEDGLSIDAFILMELLTPLIEHQKSSVGLTVQQSATLVQNISNALSSCHAKKIIHGDLKPENILFDGTTFKLSDFGVSRCLHRELHRKPNGTPFFQPPTINRGCYEDSVESDIYSFGMTLYVIFNNGMIPFQNELNRQSEQAAWENICKHFNSDDFSFPAPRYATPEIAQVILKAISPNEADRYKTPSEFSLAYQAAYELLSENQRLMYLPYNETDETISKADRIYLSTGRRTIQGGTKQDTKSETSCSNTSNSDGGFELPPDDGESATLNNCQHENNTYNGNKSIQETAGRHSKKRILFFVLPALVIALLIFLLLQENHMNLDIKANRFDAELTVAADSKPISARVNFANTQNGYEITSENQTFKISGLAPDTNYSITVQAGSKTDSISLHTLPAIAKRFQPFRQRLFMCESTLLDTRSIQELISGNDVTELTNLTLSLRPIPLLNQNVSILFCCTAHCDAGSYESGTMHLVLRASDDVITRSITISQTTLENDYCYTVQDYSSMFDEYYSRHKAHCSGTVRLEMYWLDELLGSAELTLNQ